MYDFYHTLLSFIKAIVYNTSLESYCRINFDFIIFNQKNYCQISLGKIVDIEMKCTEQSTEKTIYASGNSSQLIKVYFSVSVNN